jgi:hypothetical protein
MSKLILAKCLRCRGTLTYEKFYGVGEQFWGWKCLICGEIIDPVILANRQLMNADEGVKAQRLRPE